MVARLHHKRNSSCVPLLRWLPALLVFGGVANYAIFRAQMMSEQTIRAVRKAPVAAAAPAPAVTAETAATVAAATLPSAPAATLAAATLPSETAQAVTAPAATLPATVPAVTAPAATQPAETAQAATAPAVSQRAVTAAPELSIPELSIPALTLQHLTNQNCFPLTTTRSAVAQPCNTFPHEVPPFEQVASDLVFRWIDAKNTSADTWVERPAPDKKTDVVSTVELIALLPMRVHSVAPYFDPKLLIRYGAHHLLLNRDASALGNVSVVARGDCRQYYPPPSLLVIANALSMPDGNVVVPHGNRTLILNSYNGQCTERKGGIAYTLKPTSHVGKILSLGTGEWPSAMFHSFANMLTRLGAHVSTLLRDDDVFVHFHKDTSRSTRGFVQLLGIPGHRILYGGDVSADLVFVPATTDAFSTAGRAHTWPLRVHYWRALNMSVPPPQSRIVIIVRPIWNKRFVANNDAMVAAIVQEFPNETVTLLHLSNFNETKNIIHVFSTAKMVIAPHGAGLLHLMFSPPSTHVLEFMFHKNLLCFRELALEMGHHYTAVMYPHVREYLSETDSIPSDEGRIYTIGNHDRKRDAVVVHVQSVVAWIRKRLA